MTWDRVLEILTAEVGAEAAKRIKDHMIRELGGLRVSIPANHRPRPTAREIDAALRETRYSVARAAALLGISRAALYNRLHRPKPQPKPPRPPLLR